MKNVDEFYEKYYNAYKNDYGNDDELSEDKKNKFNYRKFELFDETDKKSKLDEETENFFKNIENQEKNVDKRVFMKYFRYEPTALVNELLDQNTQDLRKILDDIKQQKDELDKDERNSTNNKNENDRLNMIVSVIDRIYQFFKYKILQGEQPTQLTEPLPDEDRSNIKQPTQLKHLNPNKIPKPLWIEISKDDFMSLIKELMIIQTIKITKLKQVIIIII